MKRCIVLFFLLLSKPSDTISNIDSILLGQKTLIESKPNVRGVKRMNISKIEFGQLKEGEQMYSYLLKNNNGMEVELIEYGAAVVALRVPDKNGRIADVILGYDDLNGYTQDPYYFGATIGRLANRLSGALFSIDGKTDPGRGI